MAESEIRISKMEEADIDQVLELGIRATELTIDPHARHLYNKETLLRLTDSPNGLLLVAKERKDLVGFSIGSFHPDFEDGEIRLLEVVLSYQSRGIEDLLLDQTLARFNELGCKRIIAWEKPGNAAGLDLFRRHNFSIHRSYFNLELVLRSE